MFLPSCIMGIRQKAISSCGLDFYLATRTAWAKFLGRSSPGLAVGKRFLNLRSFGHALSS